MPQASNFVKVRLQNFGLFFNLDIFSSAVLWAEPRNAVPVPHWPSDQSLYAQAGTGDAWDSLFLRTDHQAEDRSRCRRTLRYSDVKGYSVMAPKVHMYPQWYTKIRPAGDGEWLFEPPKRTARSSLAILRHVKIKNDIRRRARNFYYEKLSGRRLIGLHVRGPRAVHDGAPLLTFAHGYETFPPYDEYARRVEQHMRPDTRILLCTDAKEVQDHFKNRWGSDVVTTCVQPEGGEAHERNIGDPHARGVQALVDAWLLSTVDILIHGVSNMSSFILCMSHKMPHEYVYDKVRTGHIAALQPPRDLSKLRKWLACQP
jgi:hypothetical protein